jgi:nitroreductase
VQPGGAVQELDLSAESSTARMKEHNVIQRYRLSFGSHTQTIDGDDFMELMQTIVTRRATREYTDSPVESARIEQFINAANLAPSAMNRQPWAFIVLTNPQRIAEYASRGKDWLLHNIDQYPDGSSIQTLLKDPAYCLLHNAPALVLILATSHEPQATEDCCLAAENFMLAARDEGVGTCWVGLARPWFNLGLVKTELEVPDKYQVVAPIVLGYPKQWPEPRERNPVEIHWVS